MQVEGAERLERDNTYVVVSNHLSNLDAPLHIANMPVPIRFLAKSELFRVPVFGQAMRAVGMVATDRSAHGAAHRTINERVTRVVEMRKCLMVYPEGRRSRDGELKAFKKGAFRIAIENQLPLVPVTIARTDRAWKPGSNVIRGGKTYMVIHDPIPTDGAGRADIDELRDRVHAIIEQSYAEIRTR